MQTIINQLKKLGILCFFLIMGLLVTRLQAQNLNGEMCEDLLPGGFENSNLEKTGRILREVSGLGAQDELQFYKDFHSLGKENQIGHLIFRPFNHTSDDQKIKRISLSKSHYGKLLQLGKRYHRSPRLCRNKLWNYYKKNSIWANFDRTEKLKLIFEHTSQIFQEIYHKGQIKTCSRPFLDIFKTIYYEQVNHYFKSLVLDLWPTWIKDPKRILRKDFVRLFTHLKEGLTWNAIENMPVQGSVFYPKIEAKEISIPWPIDWESSTEMANEFRRKKARRGVTNQETVIDFFSSYLAKEVMYPLKVQYEKNLSLSMVMGMVTLSGNFSLSDLKDCKSFGRLISIGDIDLGTKELYQNRLNDYLARLDESLDAMNPNQFHHLLTPDLARCVIHQETRSTLDPHTLNYTYCSRRFMRSTAHGLGQTTFTTFHFLRKVGLLPLTNTQGYRPTRFKDNKYLFEALNENVPMQIETIYRHLNYLLKKRKTLNLAIASYDMDDRSKYSRNINSCLNCLKGHSTEDLAAIKECF